MPVTADQLLEPIFRSPEMPKLVDRLVLVRNQEAERRRRFREEVDESAKAEFINGEVILHSPASARHVLVVGRLVELLRIYRRATKAGQVYFEKAMIGLERNDYEPDVIFYLEPRSSQILPETNIFPVPDFVAEVLSPSTSGRDRGIKFESYASAGIREYWIIDADTRTVEQYVLEDLAYLLRAKVCDGILHSIVLPGFFTPAAALFDDSAHDAFIATEPWKAAKGVSATVL